MPEPFDVQTITVTIIGGVPQTCAVKPHGSVNAVEIDFEGGNTVELNIDPPTTLTVNFE